MLRSFTTLMALTLTLGLAACEEPTTYPVSGEECTPGDPVQGLDAGDCVVPVPGVGAL